MVGATVRFKKIANKKTFTNFTDMNKLFRTTRKEYLLAEVNLEN